MAVLIALSLLFWRSVKIWAIKRKLSELKLRKNSITGLIKKTQLDYFKSKKIGELEFNVKMETFKNLIRDIDRQVPLYSEQLAKMERAKKVYKQK